MAARIIDGTAIAAEIRGEAASRVAAFTKRAGRKPALAIVLVGDRPDSQIYVRNKLKMATDAGLHAEASTLPATASLEQVLETVRRLNASPLVDAVLVQSPLPRALGVSAMQQVFDLIDPVKDVDGVTPLNVGLLMQNRAALVACTPAGVMEMLERSQIAIDGAHAVVIGRSEIVGKPLSVMLLHRNATVTICHSHTQQLAALAATADILVAALGQPGFVRRSHVKPGATVVDVGINRVTDMDIAQDMLGAGSERLRALERGGSVLVGDVHPEVAEVAGALTPVPGGVGPVTIAMVLANTVTAAERRAVRR
jgi:methylenetetrahydrofolate dehydrogenase (NADP+) / methenyltetrahydrofolate cyclohydrolase